MHPIDLLKEWLKEEKAGGAQYAEHAVLSTQGVNGFPHGRVVAIRAIEQDSLLFFTQKITRKVAEIKACSAVTLTFWLERGAREVIVEGEAEFLSAADNEKYWNTYSQWAQIRFCSYAPTSGQPIENKQILEDKRLAIEQSCQNTTLPLSPDYCGILVRPQRLVFYSYRLDELSDVWEYQQQGTELLAKRLSP